MSRSLYVENGVGRSVLRALELFEHNIRCELLWQHDVHPQMQRPQHGDEWWIRDITERSHAILTQDARILTDPVERSVVMEAGARVVALGSGEYSQWDKLRAVARNWSAIDALLDGDGPAAIVVSLSEASRIDLRGRS